MIKVITGIVFGLWFALAPALASTVAVDSQEAKIWANTKGQELLQALSESDPISKYSKLDKMLTEDVNLDYISKFVIGKYARLMNREQQARYRGLWTGIRREGTLREELPARAALQARKTTRIYPPTEQQGLALPGDLGRLLQGCGLSCKLHQKAD